MSKDKKTSDATTGAIKTVSEEQVMIVDEQTGRIMDGRRYSDGSAPSD